MALLACESTAAAAHKFREDDGEARANCISNASRMHHEAPNHERRPEKERPANKVDCCLLSFGPPGAYLARQMLGLSSTSGQPGKALAPTNGRGRFDSETNLLSAIIIIILLLLDGVLLRVNGISAIDISRRVAIRVSIRFEFS